MLKKLNYFNKPGVFDMPRIKRLDYVLSEEKRLEVYDTMLGIEETEYA
jgi:hypothetical protein